MRWAALESVDHAETMVEDMARASRASLDDAGRCILQIPEQSAYLSVQIIDRDYAIQEIIDLSHFRNPGVEIQFALVPRVGLSVRARTPQGLVATGIPIDVRRSGSAVWRQLGATDVDGRLLVLNVRPEFGLLELPVILEFAPRLGPMPRARPAAAAVVVDRPGLYEVDLPVPDHATVSFQILDHAGKPARFNADDRPTVFVEVEGLESHGNQVSRAGFVSIPLQLDHRYVVGAAGALVERQELFLRAGRDPGIVFLRPPADAVVLSGRCVNAEGEPVEGRIDIQIESMKDTEAVSSAYPDDEGYFVVTVPARDRPPPLHMIFRELQTMNDRSPRGAAITMHAQFAEDIETYIGTVQLAKVPTMAMGRVVWRDGEPVDAPWVRLERYSPVGQGRWLRVFRARPVFGPAGAFTMRDHPGPWRYRLAIGARIGNGTREQVFDLEPGARDLELRLSR